MEVKFRTRELYKEYEPGRGQFAMQGAVGHKTRIGAAHVSMPEEKSEKETARDFLAKSSKSGRAHFKTA